MAVDWRKFPEYDALVAEGVASGDSYPEIAETLSARYGISVNADMVRARVRHGYVPPPGAELIESEERFEARVKDERQKAADRAFAREMAEAIKGKARWDEFLDLVSAEFQHIPHPPLEQLSIPTGSGSPEVMTVLVGDIHIGKLVDPNVVGSGFGYGFPIFEQRFSRLKDRILRLYALHSQTAPIETIRIYFLGDGTDGVDMRRGHAHRVDIQTATQQTIVLTYAFENLIRELSDLLGVPIEIVWEFGNHGRVGEFGVNLPADNWDYIAGQMLGIATRDMIQDGRLKLHADTLKYSITQLGPYRVYSSHGDSVKGGDGFAGLPINGLARGLAKDTGMHLQLFDLYLTAHFHTPQDIQTQAGRIIMNGAWDGGDDYSINQIKAASEPVQLAFGIHPERGMTWQSRIHLAPSRRLPSPVSAL